MSRGSLAALGLCIALAGLAWTVIVYFDQPPTTENRQSSRSIEKPVRFVDVTASLGRQPDWSTFSLAVADIDNNGFDDILVGYHLFNPVAYLGRGGTFHKFNGMFPEGFLSDRHGYTLVDKDNDGDLDVLVAGGGEDGVGKGSANIMLKNLLVEDGVLSFANETGNPELENPLLRSRGFLPYASSTGAAVDVYLSTLPRKGLTNLVFNGTGSDFALQSDHTMNRSLKDHGRGIIADFDGDGKQDFMLLEASRLVAYWGAEGEPERLSKNNNLTIAAGDLNNDGLLDFYLGKHSRSSRLDRVSANRRKLQFAITDSEADDVNRLKFKASGHSIKINFNQHLPLTVASWPASMSARSIFVGANKSNPKSRVATIARREALDMPDFSEPGTYIWYDDEAELWNLKWIFGGDRDVYKGELFAKKIWDIELSGTTRLNPKGTRDVILFNQGGRKFRRFTGRAFAHSAKTSSVTMADVNHDGWLDIVGVRHRDDGAPNGRPYILLNKKGEAFERIFLPATATRDLSRADGVAVGFFDSGNSPDIVVTNGFGQLPGNTGPTRLYLNRSPNLFPALRLRLRGTRSNHYAVGARVQIYDHNRDLLGTRVVGLNANITRDTDDVHFGLGDAKGPFTLEIKWPGDSQLDVRPITRSDIDQVITITQ